MINIFDWYQSFAVVLETQRERGLETGNQKRTGGLDERRQGDEGGQSEDGEWGMEVQARFIRGVHDLDLMGFLKHTGRKPDHVARTAFNVSE